MFWQSLKIVNFFIFNTSARFSQTTTLTPLFKFYPMLWYCLQRINSFDGLHCGLILDFQFFEANGSETSVDVRSMQSLNRTKRSASRSLRKTHVVCLLTSSFKTSFSFNRQYHSLPTSALCRFGRLNCSVENFAADFFKNRSSPVQHCQPIRSINSNYWNSKNAKKEPCFNFFYVK